MADWRFASIGGYLTWTTVDEPDDEKYLYSELSPTLIVGHQEKGDVFPTDYVMLSSVAAATLRDPTTIVLEKKDEEDPQHILFAPNATEAREWIDMINLAISGDAQAAAAGGAATTTGHATTTASATEKVTANLASQLEPAAPTPVAAPKPPRMAPEDELSRRLPPPPSSTQEQEQQQQSQQPQQQQTSQPPQQLQQQSQQKQYYQSPQQQQQPQQQQHQETTGQRWSESPAPASTGSQWGLGAATATPSAPAATHTAPAVPLAAATPSTGGLGLTSSNSWGAPSQPANILSGAANVATKQWGAPTGVAGTSAVSAPRTGGITTTTTTVHDEYHTGGVTDPTAPLAGTDKARQWVDTNLGTATSGNVFSRGSPGITTGTGVGTGSSWLSGGKNWTGAGDWSQQRTMGWAVPATQNTSQLGGSGADKENAATRLTGASHDGTGTGVGSGGSSDTWGKSAGAGAGASSRPWNIAGSSSAAAPLGGGMNTWSRLNSNNITGVNNLNDSTNVNGNYRGGMNMNTNNNDGLNGNHNMSNGSNNSFTGPNGARGFPTGGNMAGALEQQGLNIQNGADNQQRQQYGQHQQQQLQPGQPPVSLLNDPSPQRSTFFNGSGVPHTPITPIQQRPAGQSVPQPDNSGSDGTPGLPLSGARKRSGMFVYVPPNQQLNRNVAPNVSAIWKEWTDPEGVLYVYHEPTQTMHRRVPGSNEFETLVEGTEDIPEEDLAKHPYFDEISDTFVDVNGNMVRNIQNYGNQRVEGNIVAASPDLYRADAITTPRGAYSPSRKARVSALVPPPRQSHIGYEGRRVHQLVLATGADANESVITHQIQPLNSRGLLWDPKTGRAIDPNDPDGTNPRNVGPSTLHKQWEHVRHILMQGRYFKKHALKTTSTAYRFVFLTGDNSYVVCVPTSEVLLNVHATPQTFNTVTDTLQYYGRESRAIALNTVTRVTLGSEEDFVVRKSGIVPENTFCIVSRTHAFILECNTTKEARYFADAWTFFLYHSKPLYPVANRTPQMKKPITHGTRTGVAF